jgi:hypothetical protein
MKIDKVIFTCDDNPAYSGFWKSISTHFYKKLGIKSHLFLIADDESVKDNFFQNDEFCEITFVKKLTTVPSIVQALWGKFYFTKTEPETIWMIGDLDLYPLQKNWFVNNIEKYDDNSYLHLHGSGNGNEWWNEKAGLAGFYHVAKGKIFSEMLEFDESFEKDCQKIIHGGYGLDPSNPAHIWAHQASPDWRYFCCEEQYTGQLLKSKKDKVISINWPTSNFDTMRICRSNGLVYNINLLESGFYIDLHSPRPFEKYEKEINQIISKVPDLK